MEGLNVKKSNLIFELKYLTHSNKHWKVLVSCSEKGLDGTACMLFAGRWN